MAIPVIVMGATGRMGSVLIQMVQSDSQFSLVGAVETQEKLHLLKNCPCPVADDVFTLLERNKEAFIIDFTAPSVSMAIARKMHRYTGGHIIGTTGLSDDDKKELAELAKQTRIFWSPNMSIGINALLSVLPQLTKLLGDNYDVEMMEIHHNKKKDSPSGTALRLAECLADARDWSLDATACYHREGIIGERPHEEIGIQTLRGGDVVGVHTVYFMGPGERIEVTHQAHSRENFASGALRAIVWLHTQRAGQLYSMQDVLRSEN